MRYKFRNNADRGLWLAFLLPSCLFPLAVKSQLAVDKLIFVVIAWLAISQLIKEVVYVGKISILEPRYIFHVLLSIPASFGISWMISYNMTQVYLICLISVLSYNYLISKMLMGFQGSFTFGEVQIIAQGIIIFVIHSLNSLKQLDEHHFYGTKYTEAMDLLMLLHLGLFLLVCSLNFIPSLRKSISFHLISFGFVVLMMSVWSYFHQQNAILWLFEFCTLTRKRVYLILIWLILTLTSISFVIYVNQKTNCAISAMDRKYFHVIINAVFIPGVIYDVQFLCFASGIILGIFILLEMYRILDVPVIGTAVGQAFQIFLDEKDSGVLILTHIYLLIGCSCPVWLSSYYVHKNEYHISLFSGIISVGFGDTFAAIGGTLFGKHCWQGSKKTLEGSACAFIAQLFCSVFFVYIGHHFSPLTVMLVIESIFLTSLLEAKTDQIDNLVLPLFMFSMLSWIDELLFF